MRCSLFGHSVDAQFIIQQDSTVEKSFQLNILEIVSIIWSRLSTDQIIETNSCLTVPNQISIEIGAKRDAHVERGT
jgi:hypothetical protein